MLFINPPFGNYIHLKYTTPIKGSFTLKPRGHLFLRIIKTLRYSFSRKGWVNKIGLRNPGIDYAINHYYSENKKNNNIISVAILNKEEIPLLYEKIPNDCNIELNISCPNVENEKDKEHSNIYEELNIFLHPNRKWCIIKLSPIEKIETIDTLYNIGFRQFHCCNTLPIKEGGLSGSTLLKYNVPLLKQIKEKYPDTELIAGGGIRNIHTLQMFQSMGIKHFSVSTLCFNPFLFIHFYWNYVKYFS